MRRLSLTLVIVGTAFAGLACGGDSSEDETSISGGTGQGGLAATGVTGPTGTTTVVPPASSGKKRQRSGKADDAPASSETAKAPSSASGSGEAGRQKKRTALERDLYNQGKTVCGGFTLAQLARDYNPESNEPADVARAYAKAYVHVDLPKNRAAVYDGCLAALRAKAR